MDRAPTELVKKTAALARLRIDDQEAEALGRDFAKILEAFEDLTELEVEGVEPMTGATLLSDVTRPGRTATEPRAGRRARVRARRPRRLLRGAQDGRRRRVKPYREMDATELVAAIAAGELSVADAVRSALEEVDRQNPALNALLEGRPRAGRSLAPTSSTASSGTARPPERCSASPSR